MQLAPLTVFYTDTPSCQVCFTATGARPGILWKSWDNPPRFKVIRDSTPIGERVRARIEALLEERGMPQRTFAKHLGHGDQWASNLLNRRQTLTMADLDGVADVLGVTTSDLVRRSSDPYELSALESRVVRALRLLPDVIRQHLATLTDYLVGATPAEVVLLHKLRQLDADGLRRIEHFADVTLLKAGIDPAQANLRDLKVSDVPRSAKPRRNQGR